MEASPFTPNRRYYYYYYYYCSEHSASPTAVAAYTIVLHLSLSWVVVMASFIVSPSLSFIVLVSLVFCRPLDRLPNTIPLNKSFSMHLCLIMCPINWSFCCSIWLTSPLYSPISSSMLSFDLFSVQLTLNNLLYAEQTLGWSISEHLYFICDNIYCKKFGNQFIEIFKIYWNVIFDPSNILFFCTSVKSYSSLYIIISFVAV